jgi:hypothetical protein
MESSIRTGNLMHINKRTSPRAKVSRMLRVRPSDPGGEPFEELPISVNVSKRGIYFHTHLRNYRVGLRLFVTYPMADSAKVTYLLRTKSARMIWWNISLQQRLISRALRYRRIKSHQHVRPFTDSPLFPSRQRKLAMRSGRFCEGQG